MTGKGLNKRKYCWRLWPFLKRDSRFVPDYLQKQERKGLRFCSILTCLPVAKYEKTEPTSAVYCVDVFSDLHLSEIEPYLEASKQAGWEIRWQWDEYKIFRAEEGVSARKLQTDHTVQQEILSDVWRRNALHMFLSLCMVGFLLLAVLFTSPFFYIATMWFQLFVAAWVALEVYIAVCCVDAVWMMFKDAGGKLSWEQSSSAVREHVVRWRGIVCGVILYTLIFSVWILYLVIGKECSSLHLNLITLIGLMNISGAFLVGHTVDDRIDKPSMKSVEKGYVAVFLAVMLIVLGMASVFGVFYEPFDSNATYSNLLMKQVKRSDINKDISEDQLYIEARTSFIAEKYQAILEKETNEVEREHRVAKRGEALRAEVKNTKTVNKASDMTVDEMEERKPLTELQLMEYGEYDSGYRYPLSGRVLLRKECIIVYTTDKKQNKQEDTSWLENN